MGNSSRNGMRPARWYRGVIVLVLGMACWSGVGYAADVVPEQTNDFIRICSSRGLFAKVFDDHHGALTNCAWWMGYQAELASLMDEGQGCRDLKSIIGESPDDQPGARVVQPIFDWLRANRANSSNEVGDDTADAMWALYRCR